MSTFIDMSYELWYDNLMIKDTNIRVTFVTTKDNKARLETIATKQKRTLSSQLDYLVENWLKEHEDVSPAVPHADSGGAA